MGGAEPVSDDVNFQGAISEREMRVSDSEREHVGQLLQRAVGLGMLSLGEFTERMDTALAAKTRGELNAVVVDLPGMRLSDGRQMAGRPVPQQHPYPGAHGVSVPAGLAQQPVGYPRQPAAYNQAGSGNVIRGRLASVHRRGPWQVTPTLYLNSWLSSITLDFTEAIMSTQVVELHLDDFCSSVTLIVPSAATVDLNPIDLIGSSVNNKVRNGPPFGPLHLVVYGQIRFGSVTAKQPFLANWRRLMGNQ